MSVRAAPAAALLLVLAGAWGAGSSAQSIAVPDEPSMAVADTGSRVEQPDRAFGRMIGDVLTQRVRLADGETIDEQALPAAGRTDVWFARLPSAVVDGRAGERHVELRYQIVNSPDAATVAALPPTELTLIERPGEQSGGDPAIASPPAPIAVPSWPIVIVPLLPAAAARAPDVPGPDGLDVALPAMRPDRLLPPLDTAPHRERIRAATAALVGSLAAWSLWWAWRRRRDATRLPFARARAELRGLAAASREEDPRAWRAAHAALNATAGSVSGPATLDALLERAPWLLPHRERLLAFHDASAGRFFEQPPRLEPFELQALVRDLERAERRQAS